MDITFKLCHLGKMLILSFNSLSVDRTKWSKTLKQLVGSCGVGAYKVNLFMHDVENWLNKLKHVKAC